MSPNHCPAAESSDGCSAAAPRVGRSRRFGGLLALGGIDLDVARGERLAVLGPNGAGKTTLFNVVAGDITPPRARSRSRASTARRCRRVAGRSLGVARTYQKTRLFPGLTVEDNLYLAVDRQATVATGRCGGRRRRASARTRPRRAARTVWLGDHLDAVVGDLSHGQQRQLEVGHGAGHRADLMMLDEPASGLVPRRARTLDRTARDARRSTSTLLLIEHDMDVALQVADRVVVMADGMVDRRRHPRRDPSATPLVHDIYLGRQAPMTRRHRSVFE